MAPVWGHPKLEQMYHLYTDASDYAIAAALQQIQFMVIKDLKDTQIHKRSLKLYKKSKGIPELVMKLSKEDNNCCPMPEWSTNWEDTLIPVEQVVAYWSRVLVPAETRYSATKREASATKESLIISNPS